MAEKRDQILDHLKRLRVGAIIRTRDEQSANDAMRAAVDGGMRMIEFTLNTPGAMALIRKFSGELELVVGAGTVRTPEQVREAVDAGARFIVSPHADPGVIAAANACDVVSIPGTFTPSEMVWAVSAGADVVKLFPAPHNIATYVRQIAAPLPDLRIFPTAGVTPANFRDILSAGAFGVGFVSSLFTPEDMAAKNYSAIERRAADILAKLDD